MRFGNILGPRHHPRTRNDLAYTPSEGRHGSDEIVKIAQKTRKRHGRVRAGSHQTRRSFKRAEHRLALHRGDHQSGMTVTTSTTLIRTNDRCSRRGVRDDPELSRAGCDLIRPAANTARLPVDSARTSGEPDACAGELQPAAPAVAGDRVVDWKAKFRGRCRASPRSRAR